MARILLGITGSVAAVKAPALYEQLVQAQHEVKVVATEASRNFFDESRLPTPEVPAEAGPLVARNQATVYFDADEWPSQRLFQVGEPVLHIELRKWAQLLLIAPLDANTLAKLSMGLCDNLLSCVYRAWDFRHPVILAPAMNTYMWEHPATVRHLAQLAEDFGCTRPLPHLDVDAVCDTINSLATCLYIVKPVSKQLACGDLGMGGLAEVEQIVSDANRLVAGSAEL